MKQVGDIIYQLRMEKKLTQRDLALLVGIPQPNLSNIEKGKQDVTVGTLQRLTAVLGCSLSQFFGEFEKQPEVEVFSRERIERIAESIVSGACKGSARDEEIVRLFQTLQPRKATQMQPRKTYKAWSQLRVLLSKQTIDSVHERVRDAEMRKAL